MEKLRITEALGKFAQKHGRRMTQDELAKYIYPESSVNSRNVNIAKLKNGKTKRVSITTVKRLCEKLDVDANFLFGIDK